MRGEGVQNPKNFADVLYVRSLIRSNFMYLSFQSLGRAVMMHVSGMEQRRRHIQQDVDALNKTLSAMDSRLDKQRFIESNNSAFMIPKKFEYAPVRRDETETLVQKSILDELEIRKQSLITRLKVNGTCISDLSKMHIRKTYMIW